jgi:hypothetical protein
LHERNALRRGLNGSRKAIPVRTQPADFDAWHERTLSLLGTPQLATALDLSREPKQVTEAYGSHLFGQGCLLARRLVEAGITFVTVYWHYEGPDDSPVWDTHWNNYPHLRNRLVPPTDQAVSSLLGDLASRGMLDETLVVCLGEFGRTPKINTMAGRDHWPNVQSLLLAGGGIRGGQIYGASDPQGAFPADNPVAPNELIATILHLLGVPPHFEIHDRFGRILPATHGRPLLELV